MDSTSPSNHSFSMPQPHLRPTFLGIILKKGRVLGRFIYKIWTTHNSVPMKSHIIRFALVFFNCAESCWIFSRMPCSRAFHPGEAYDKSLLQLHSVQKVFIFSLSFRMWRQTSSPHISLSSHSHFHILFIPLSIHCSITICYSSCHFLTSKHFTKTN